MDNIKKIAVVLFNLGGPDNLSSVEPFLFNLFNDKSIIDVPFFIRWILAKFISKKRSYTACRIYEKIGGRSPQLDQTKKQAYDLEKELNKEKNNIKVFISMRYWHPLSSEAIESVVEFNPDLIVLLPLYPQYSTVTTGSSFKDWRKISKIKKINKKTIEICCWPVQEKWIKTISRKINNCIKNLNNKKNIRILFSAHGIPKRIILSGDPYQNQVEQTIYSIVSCADLSNMDWRICYQSRIGPLEWIGPSTEEEVRRAGKDGVSLIVVPVAFVSENSETLVELDMEYKKLAYNSGVPLYIRIDTVQNDSEFIKGLAELVFLYLNKKNKNTLKNNFCGFKKCHNKLNYFKNF